MAALALLLAGVGVSARAAADQEEALSTKIIPLPMYATLPTEGSTYGVMPVFMKTRVTAQGDEPGGVYSITAPSVSWNAAAGVTATLRYYRYLDLVRTWTLVESFSTHINRTIWFTYDNLIREPSETTLNAVVMIRRNLFFRYFGLGPDTTEAGESSYTRTTATANARWGYNLTRDLNLGVYGEIRGDKLERHPIFGLPALQDRYPDAPGVHGAALLRQGVTLRFDTREGGDYADQGLSSELGAFLAEGITGTSLFGQLTWHTRVLVPEASFLQFGARLYWTQVIGSDVAFYYRPSLGGELLLRGFPLDRFFGMGAWEAEIEQRIRFLQTNLFGVIADWRVDPFVSVGQVYDGFDLFSHVRLTGGIGLRAWVRPNVLGRVDLAYSSEGIRAYVVLGYPF